MNFDKRVGETIFYIMNLRFITTTTKKIHFEKMYDPENLPRTLNDWASIEF